jgi:membrane protein
MFRILTKAFREWRNDRASLLAAALAYYAVFALAPLLLLVIAVTALILNEQSAQREVLGWMEGAAGEEAARFVVTALQARSWVNASWTASLVSIGVMLFASLGLLGTLRVCLNAVWHVEAKPSNSWLHAVAKKIGTLIIVIIAGGLLLLSTIASALMGAFLDIASAYVAIPPATLGVLQILLFFVISSLLFLAIFKALPDTVIAWREAMVGAAFTGLLFVLGATLLSRYLAATGIASAYGAAGSLIALLLWIYYSSQILLFGAECTKVYAQFRGEPIKPDAFARSTDDPALRKGASLSLLQKGRIVLKTLLVEVRVLRFLLWIRRLFRRDTGGK